jgi:hypothetical protein
VTWCLYLLNCTKIVRYKSFVKKYGNRQVTTNYPKSKIIIQIHTLIHMIEDWKTHTLMHIISNFMTIRNNYIPWYLIYGCNKCLSKFMSCFVPVQPPAPIHTKWWTRFAAVINKHSFTLFLITVVDLRSEDLYYISFLTLLNNLSCYI